MAAPARETRRSRRGWFRASVLLPLALTLSCADMPTAPRALVEVSGRLIDREGSPVAWAHVRFYASEALPELSSGREETITDAAGQYRILLPSARYSVRIEPAADSGYPLVTIPDFAPKPGASTLDYRYEGFRVQGQITGPDGLPFLDSHAWIVPLTSPLLWANSSLAGGRYSLLVPAGSYDLAVGPGHYYGNVALPHLRFRSLNVASDTTIDVALTGSKIDLTVTLGGSAPLANAYVGADGPDASAAAATDAAGTITLYLPPATYSIEIEPRDANVVNPDTGYMTVQGDQSISMDVPTVRWSGTLRRLADASPLPYSAVEVRQSGPYSTAGAWAATDAAGHFELFVRPGRPYDVRVETLGASPPDTWYGYAAYSLSSAADSTFDLTVDSPTP